MKKLTLVIALIVTLTVQAQEKYFFLSGGLDPKILLMGTDNEYTQHGKGIDYVGKIGFRDGNIEAAGFIETYEDIGYRAMGLSFNYVPFRYNNFDFIVGAETSIISRKEVLDEGLNKRWMEYLPSIGGVAEIRYNINKRFALGWIAVYKTRPDLDFYDIGSKIRFSTTVQLYVKF